MPPLNDQSGSSLMTLMNLRSKPGSSGNIPSMSTEDQFYDDMVGEEDLYAMQDEIAERGRASGGAYAIPSREEMRKSARAQTRRALAPTMIAEQGAERRAALQAQGQRDALLRFLVGEQNKEERAQMNNQAAYDRAAMVQEQTGGRQASNQEAQTRRAQLRDTAMQQRAQAGLGVKRAGELDKQIQQAGWLDSIKELFGYGSLPGKRQEAQQLRQQAMQGYANQPLPGDEEADEGIDVSPEEWAEFQAYRARGGR